MSRFFNNNGYLGYNGGIVTSYPLTMAAWVIHTTTGSDVIMVSGTSGSGYHAHTLETDGVNYVRARSTGSGSSSSAISASTIPDTTGWHHAAGTFTNGTTRLAYLNGVVGGATEPTARNPTGINYFQIGASPVPGTYWSGNIAHPAVWNVTLSAGDIAALAAGASPLMIRPDALVAYWPYIGRDSPEINVVNAAAAYDLTVTNTSVEATEPDVLRGPRQYWFMPAAAAASTKAPPFSARFNTALLSM